MSLSAYALSADEIKVSRIPLRVETGTKFVEVSFKGVSVVASGCPCADVDELRVRDDNGDR